MIRWHTTYTGDTSIDTITGGIDEVDAIAAVARLDGNTVVLPGGPRRNPLRRIRIPADRAIDLHHHPTGHRPLTGGAAAGGHGRAQHPEWLTRPGAPRSPATARDGMPRSGPQGRSTTAPWTIPDHPPRTTAPVTVDPTAIRDRGAALRAADAEHLGRRGLDPAHRAGNSNTRPLRAEKVPIPTVLYSFATSHRPQMTGVCGPKWGGARWLPTRSSARHVTRYAVLLRLWQRGCGSQVAANFQAVGQWRQGVSLR